MPGSWSSAKQMVTTFYASVEKTPDEGDIVQMLKQAAKMQGLSSNGKEFEQAFRELRSQLLDKVPEGTTLTDNEKTVWEEWLPEMKASELSFPRWLAYYQYLQKRLYPAPNLRQVHRTNPRPACRPPQRSSTSPTQRSCTWRCAIRQDPHVHGIDEQGRGLRVQTDRRAHQF